MSSRGDDGLGRDAIDRLAGPGERAPVDRRIETDRRRRCHRESRRRSTVRSRATRRESRACNSSAFGDSTCSVPLHARLVMSAFDVAGDRRGAPANVDLRDGRLRAYRPRRWRPRGLRRAAAPPAHHWSPRYPLRDSDTSRPASSAHPSAPCTSCMIAATGKPSVSTLFAVCRHVADPRVRRTAHGAERRRAAIDAALHPAFEW